MTVNNKDKERNSPALIGTQLKFAIRTLKKFFNLRSKDDQTA